MSRQFIRIAALIAASEMLGGCGLSRPLPVAPKKSSSPPDPNKDEFHQHLDECQQCADHPFNLCPTGVILIQKSGEEAAKGHPARPFPL